MSYSGLWWCVFVVVLYYTKALQITSHQSVLSMLSTPELPICTISVYEELTVNLTSFSQNNSRITRVVYRMLPLRLAPYNKLGVFNYSITTNSQDIQVLQRTPNTTRSSNAILLPIFFRFKNLTEGVFKLSYNLANLFYTDPDTNKNILSWSFRQAQDNVQLDFAQLSIVLYTFFNGSRKEMVYNVPKNWSVNKSEIATMSSANLESDKSSNIIIHFPSKLSYACLVKAPATAFLWEIILGVMLGVFGVCCCCLIVVLIRSRSCLYSVFKNINKSGEVIEMYEGTSESSEEVVSPAVVPVEETSGSVESVHTVE
ncbi:hypothetical protein AKO1_006741 [Acrasis kona]|uniref:Uncharacterized protein n=1 Tax=Acrasis kona TaxID=1008807 RepID=A0AAW2ZLT0_9EUKA